MKKSVSKYFILMVLAIMFAAPGTLAYFFYQHPTWLGTSSINKGTLISPAVVLKGLDKQSKWRIVFWSPGTCDTDCLKQLDLIGRVRLALGRKLYYVDQWLILGNKAAPLSAAANALLKEQDFHVMQLSANETESNTLAPSAQIYLANPDNYLILGYKSQVNPDDIFKDLKLLLNTTETKNG